MEKPFRAPCAPCTQWSSFAVFCVLKMIFARVYHLAASAQQISCNQSRNSVDEIYLLRSESFSSCVPAVGQVFSEENRSRE